MNRFRRLKLENSKRIIKLYSNRLKKRVYRKGVQSSFFWERLEINF